MKNYEDIYMQTRSRPPTSKKPYGWIKSVYPANNKENTFDPFILRLKRTNGMQIGHQIEEIDQETQQLLSTVKNLQLYNDKLQKSLSNELREIEALEVELMNKAMSHAPITFKHTQNSTGNATCLIKNYNRDLWLAEKEREHKNAELKKIKATQGAQEYLRKIALVRVLEGEVEEAIKLREYHTQKGKEQAKERRIALKNKIQAKQAEIDHLENKITETEEYINQSNVEEPRETKKKEKLGKKILNQQKLNKELRKKIERLQSGENGFEEYWDNFNERDLESHVIYAFFLYLIVYLKTHKLTAGFVKEVLEDAVSIDDLVKFETTLHFHLGLQTPQETLSQLFELLTFKSTPELTMFKFIKYREKITREPLYDYSRLHIPQNGSLFLFFLDQVKEEKTHHATLLKAVLESSLDHRFQDLGYFGEIPKSNKASLIEGTHSVNF